MFEKLVSRFVSRRLRVLHLLRRVIATGDPSSASTKMIPAGFQTWLSMSGGRGERRRRNTSVNRAMETFSSSPIDNERIYRSRVSLSLSLCLSTVLLFIRSRGEIFVWNGVDGGEEKKKKERKESETRMSIGKFHRCGEGKKRSV